MKDIVSELSIEEIKKGYHYSKATNQYVCNSCGEKFFIGEFFEIEKRFFDAKTAIRIHIKNDHKDYVNNLINIDLKINNLTNRQKEFLKLTYSKINDKNITTKMNISMPTLRHHRFTFREKAKQARLFLAIFESIFDNKNNENDIIDFSDKAKSVDERFMITEKERENFLKASFISLAPPKLKTFNGKEKKKIAILIEIIKQFKKDKIYTEKEVNYILKNIYSDFPYIRRSLIDYGFMKREKDGSKYWVS